MLRFALFALFATLMPAAAQDLSALSRLDGAGSTIMQRGDDVHISLALSLPVPWRLRVLDAPPRLIADFREVDFAALSDLAIDADAITGMRAGVFRAGWSRLVLELAGPMAVSRSEMRTANGAAAVNGGAEVRVTLAPIAQADFAALAAQPEPPEWQAPKSALLPPPPRAGGPLVIVLDPGHGGLDPGAERGGYSEADLMLTFARELKDVLLRTAPVQVVLTREDDVFVPLEARISAARAAIPHGGAGLFLSLHADALAEGQATGATVYTLSDEASDKAGQTLAERHDRDDLLAGVDLTAQDDLVAQVLMDMARTTTAPRNARLSSALASAIAAAGLDMHERPQQSAGFSVLKSPDIPSALLELGFLSAPQDLARLTDPAWRAKMAGALAAALTAWAAEDAILRSQTQP